VFFFKFNQGFIYQSNDCAWLGFDGIEGVMQTLKKNNCEIGKVSRDVLSGMFTCNKDFRHLF
jgi:hypothetical protein